MTGLTITAVVTGIFSIAVVLLIIAFIWFVIAFADNFKH